MKWQEHDTEDKFRSHKLSIARQLNGNDLIVKIEEWNAAGDIVTHGKIVIAPDVLREMVQKVGEE
jgi:hypothetical protein